MSKSVPFGRNFYLGCCLSVSTTSYFLWSPRRASSHMPMQIDRHLMYYIRLFKSYPTYVIRTVSYIQNTHLITAEAPRPCESDCCGTDAATTSGATTTTRMISSSACSFWMIGILLLLLRCQPNSQWSYWTKNVRKRKQTHHQATLRSLQSLS